VQSLPKMEDNTRLTVVIPTFNEQRNIQNVVKTLAKQVATTEDLWDVIFVVNSPSGLSSEEDKQNSITS